MKRRKGATVRSIAAKLGRVRLDLDQSIASGREYRQRLAVARRQTDSVDQVSWVGTCDLGKEIKVRIATAQRLGYRTELVLDANGNIMLRNVKWEAA